MNLSLYLAGSTEINNSDWKFEITDFWLKYPNQIEMMFTGKAEFGSKKMNGNIMVNFQLNFVYN